MNIEGGGREFEERRRWGMEEGRKGEGPLTRGDEGLSVPMGAVDVHLIAQ